MGEALDPGSILEESDLLLELVRSLVRNPEQVQIEEIKDGENSNLTIMVAPEDRGQVIGKQRQTLEAILHIFSKAANLDGRKVNIQLGGADVARKPRPNPGQRRHRLPQPAKLVTEYRRRA